MEKEKLRKQLEEEQLQIKEAIKVNLSVVFIHFLKRMDQNWKSFRLMEFYIRVQRLGEGVHTTLLKCTLPILR